MHARVPSVEIEIATSLGLPEICRHLRQGFGPTVWLDGADAASDAWGPRLGLDPKPRLVVPHRPGAGLASVLEPLAGILESRRRQVRASAETGLLVVLSYDAGAPPKAKVDSTPFPDLIVLEVDATVRPVDDRHVRVSATDPLRARSAASQIASFDRRPPRDLELPTDSASNDSARTSLPRDRYLAAVETLLHRIAVGDVYQANLSQRFDLPFRHDPLAVYESVRKISPAPRAALVEFAGLALISASPELFLRVDPSGLVETWPIKGTRPRGSTIAEDAAAAEALRVSVKDQAELLMIVDVERNDLSRVCQVGSVRVPTLSQLRSWPTVHHLLAVVDGRLLPEASLVDLLQATFPGGSITGAPKLSAMRILAEIEPVRRGFYTGSLLWFGDDGSLDASILIRSIVVCAGRAWIGAGGGVVADSDPEREWQEANAKARPLTRVLGFEPEQAS